jgi:hypothetical protein
MPVAPASRLPPFDPRIALTAVNPLLTAHILAVSHTPFASAAVRFNNLGTASVAVQMHQHPLAGKNIGDSRRV